MNCNLSERRLTTLAGLVVAGLFLTAGEAVAGPILYCSDGPGIDLIADGCISGTASNYPNGGDGIYSNAGGGDSEQAVEAAIFGATGVSIDLTLLGKSDAAAPFSYTPTGALDLTSSLSGTWSQNSGAGTVSYITVKAANSFALYQFSPATSVGAYNTAGILTNGGNQPTVSHISFWSSPSTDVNAVPEPSSFLLLGSGAAGLLWLRRKRSRKTA